MTVLQSLACVAGILVPFLCLGDDGLAGRPKTARYYDLAGYVSGDTPNAMPLTLEDYRVLKAEYARPENRGTKEGESWRYFTLTLVSFDASTAVVGVLSQYQSKTWTWVKRFEIKRAAEADEELGIKRIQPERAAVIGGVRHGMRVDEVIALRGQHYKVNHHQAEGSADLLYDDVKVGVRDWQAARKGGRVVSVEKATEEMKQHWKDLPYEDERLAQGENAPPRAPADAKKPHR